MSAFDYRLLMSHPIREVLVEKDALCRGVLEALPRWFGIPQAVDEYAQRVAKLPVFAVGVDGRDAGFIALEFRFDEVCEIVVMGIRPEQHRRGLGRALVDRASDFAASHGCRLLTVKIRGASPPDMGYEQTRAFFAAMGFIMVDEIVRVCEQDPCLIMVKPLALRS